MDDSTIVLRNRYRVVKRLGTGGGGSVYAVDDLRSIDGSERLALKALFIGDRNKRALLELLQQEFRVLATLRHPLLARVYDFGRFPENSGLEGASGRPGYFYTRDLIEGDDLARYCGDRAVVEICSVCQRTAEALDVLHRTGMVHRDFKPANVIVSADGRPHLIDFGLVQGEGTTSQTTGTAQYFAPEMLRGQVVDRRADLYALGITIYQLLVGERKVTGPHAGGEVCAEPPEDVVGDGEHPPLVQPPKSGSLFYPQEDVGRHGEFWQHAQLLPDDADTGRERLGRGTRVKRCSLVQQLAIIGGDGSPDAGTTTRARRQVRCGGRPRRGGARPAILPGDLVVAGYADRF